MKANLRRAFRHPVTFLRSLGSFAVSHHPECEPFDHHSLKIHGHRLCIGCFVGYPVFAASLVSLFILSFRGIQFELPKDFLFGLALQATVLLGKLFHTRRVSVKVVLKSVQAIGLALMFFPVLVIGMPLLLKVYLVMMLWTGFNGVTGAVKMYEIGKTCDSCEYKSHWSKCPGFKRTVDRLHEAGFLVS